MSVRSTLRSRGSLGARSPLGATPANGAIELKGSSLDVGRALAGGRAATLGAVGLLVMLTAGLLIALSASQTDTLLPESVRPIPGWLAGPLAGGGTDIGYGGVIAALALMFGAYLLVLRSIGGLSGRAVLAGIAALHAVILLAPPLISTDVFSYQAYARMGAIYGANPYVLGPHAIALDPLYPYIGAKWVTIPTAYGPLFTILSYPLAALDIAASVLAYKAIAAVSSLLVVVAVWKAARLRGLDPVKAVALVGLNPLVIVYGVGGGHNDLLMLAALTFGLYMLISGRDRMGAGGLIAAVGIKLTAAVVLPFALAGREAAQPQRRRAMLVGGASALLALAALAYALFGSGTLHLLSTIRRSQASGDWHSIPSFMSSLVGFGSVGHPIAYVLLGAFVLAFLLLLRGVRRRQLGWIAGAGWATFAMLVTASSLLPWYVAWLLPLAALAADRRLYRSAVVLTGVVLAIQLLGYIPPASRPFGL
jgi:alpha-1,6-mannosyltransferase